MKPVSRDKAEPVPRKRATPRPKASPKVKAEPAGWRRAEADHSMAQELGARVRMARERKGLSLAQLSEASGVPGATLSRIENNKMSPTFGVLARVMLGLDIDWADLSGPPPLPAGARLASFAEPGAGKPTHIRESTARVLHAHEAARSLPLLVEVHARDMEEVGGLIGHKGEEFCYVLSGTLALHMEGQAPRIMKAGASALFDSTTPHAYVAAGASGAKVLIVVARGNGLDPQV
jgi:transcriptional regulator with XRE-family HTH domain